MNIGDLNKRVTLARFCDVENEIGQLAQVQQAVATVWAKIEPLRGREYYEAKRIRDEATFKVTIRYRQGVTDDMVMLYKGKTMEIKDVINPNEANRYLEIMCAERVRRSGV